MKHAIDELEGSLSTMIDQFCWSTEVGDAIAASRASAMADDYAKALDVLKIVSGIKSITKTAPTQSV